MFNRNEFNAMLASKGMKQDDLAKALGINKVTLWRRLSDGNFKAEEIAIMINLFGKDKVCLALFSC